MGIFSKLKSAMIDWSVGYSTSYNEEEKVYKEIMHLLSNLDEELNELIFKSTLSDSWAIIEFQDAVYTLPLLKSLIKEVLDKNINCIGVEKNKLLGYAVQLQELYDKNERRVKSRIVKKVVDYVEFQEVYLILAELNKILVNHMNLVAIGQCGFENDNSLPNYKVIINLKNEIAKRRVIILPYLLEMDYNRGR